MSRIDESLPFQPVRFAVLTISDTRDLSQDRSGDALVERLTGAGHVLAGRALVKDEVAAIQTALRAWVDGGSCDAILTTGGTGVTGRDVTPEAVTPLFDKEIPGFGELFRMISFKSVGTSTMQSRAVGGVVGGVYLFALPGSTGAVRDAWDEILRWQFDSRHRPCNLVDIMPRLKEHLRPA